MKNYFFLLFILPMAIFGCNETSKKETISSNDVSIITDSKIHPGKIAMESNCYSCHNPQAPEGARLAPLFSTIKKAYVADTRNEKKYIAAMMNWIKNPSAATSRMPEMIKKYGVMPKMNFSEKDEKLIAEYIYNYDVSEEAVEKLTDGEFNYEKEGMKLALMTKKQLGKNLMKQINENGTLKALKFCSLKAMPIIDSMSSAHHVSISRVTDRTRNTNNQATKKEIGILNKFHIANNKGESLKPSLVHTDSNVTFYAPIKTNPMCMQCHGSVNHEVKPEAIELISKLYPSDNATGYTPNQIRGMWKVVMEKK